MRETTKELLKTINYFKQMKKTIGFIMEQQLYPVLANEEDYTLINNIVSTIFKGINEKEVLAILGEAYEEEFSEEEIVEMNKFYSSPLGLKVTEKAFAIATKGNKVIQDTVENNQEEITKIIKKYLID